MNLSNFENWLEKQIAAGLADIKFAIVPGKGVSSEAVQDEILAAEAAISAGFFRELPKAILTNAPNVQKILNSAKIA